MKKILLALLALASLHSYAQSPCALWPRYDQEVFGNVTVTSDITYGSNNDYQGANKILKMDIYQPTGDTLLQRPLIIFAHGGSFVAGDKANTDQVDLCTHFAKRGYVTATINYRLGMFPINAATATDAVFRSVQDMKAAIRFFRMDASTSNTYNVDPSMIFIGGTSAGAFTALHTAYMNTYAELPATVDTSVIGDLEGNSGNPGYSSEVNAVINLCGALGEAEWIVPGDIPLCSMHGTADQTVPYSSQMLYLLGVFPILVVDGSYAIHDYLNTFNHPAVMYTWQGAPHIPYDGGSATAIAYLDTTLRFVGNFLYSYLGCTPSDPNPSPNTTFTSTDITPVAAIPSAFIEINPADKEIIINNVPEEGIVSVYDDLGRCLEKIALNRQSGKLTVSSERFKNGVYFIHFEGIKDVEILKAVVRH